MFRLTGALCASQPNIAASCFVHPSSVLIGKVILQSDCSIWPLAVLRGDVNKISVGARSNIQDGAVIHCTGNWGGSNSGSTTVLGENVSVGHRAILHGCTIKDNALIGMGAIIMDGSVVESDVIIGAGSLVPAKKILSPGLWLGQPAVRQRDLTTAEKQWIREGNLMLHNFCCYSPEILCMLPRSRCRVVWIALGPFLPRQEAEGNKKEAAG
ncbi:putative Protein YrdA [Cardiosporidium cionae]|uniref:Gamma carbonic anhydrase n=1 Tax=Cardiosporidium cionae TaxID=476202 RepID=A0ABQ7J9N6_9APIC|nr:putative Protein YrdA [Cardiosporidium cionae]|eukprot:KAF8820680.1 putative Protein YrdA [Cardiosporidium cionae]